MDHASLAIAAALQPLLGRAARRDPAAVRVAVDHPRAVKDAVESVGVPHTEVGAVVVDGVEVGWDHRLAGGERVEVHAVGAVPDGHAGLVAPPAPAPPVRLAADVHLGTLARRMRLLGVDTSWRDDVEDAALVDHAVADGRVVLTRDRGLLMRRVVEHGVLVRSHDPDEQLVEVVERLGLRAQLAPGTRCVRCNAPVRDASPAEVADELEPGTRAAGHRRFTRCTGCGRVYWPGAHAPAIDAIVARVCPDVRPSGSS